jgi:hypothetical protein
MEQNTAMGVGGFGGSGFGNDSGRYIRAWLNLPNSGLFWQKEPVLI